MCAPMASDDVAAGDGAFSTWTDLGPTWMRKSSGCGERRENRPALPLRRALPHHHLSWIQGAFCRDRRGRIPS